MIELITDRLVSNWIETSKESVWRFVFVNMIIHFLSRLKVCTNIMFVILTKKYLHVYLCRLFKLSIFGVDYVLS